MVFVHQTCPTIVLSTLTLVLQSAAVAALIEGKSSPPRAIHWLGPWRSDMLVVRFSALILCLHTLEILWAWFYRLYCFST
jgi:hypothetical protein